jgi:hypothetical protein
MRNYVQAALLITAVALTPAAAIAQDPTQAGTPKAAATVETAVGTGVVDRVLAGTAESFPATTERLYCFSRVSNAADTEIEHVWYKGDVEMGRVKLKVGGSPWRTHSSKLLGANPSGDWRCDVVQDGNVLQSVKFKVE